MSVRHVQGKDLAEPSITLLFQTSTQAWQLLRHLLKIHPVSNN